MESRIDRTQLALLGITILVVTGIVMYSTYLIQRRTPGTRAWTRAIAKADQTIEVWPQTPRLVAGMMLERYGPPDRVTDRQVTWIDRSPWKRVIVHRYPAYSPLEQVVDYDMTVKQAEAVQEMDHGVSIDAWRAELSARSDREDLNFLALNVADDVASGRQTPEQASGFYVKTANMAAQGKSSPYLEKLLFTPRKPPIPMRDFPVK